jgi:hypothetical protein
VSEGERGVSRAALTRRAPRVCAATWSAARGRTATPKAVPARALTRDHQSCFFQSHLIDTVRGVRGVRALLIEERRMRSLASARTRVNLRKVTSASR